MDPEPYLWLLPKIELLMDTATETLIAEALAMASELEAAGLELRGRSPHLLMRRLVEALRQQILPVPQLVFRPTVIIQHGLPSAFVSPQVEPEPEPVPEPVPKPVPEPEPAPVPASTPRRSRRLLWKDMTPDLVSVSVTPRLQGKATFTVITGNPKKRAAPEEERAIDMQGRLLCNYCDKSFSFLGPLVAHQNQHLEQGDTLVVRSSSS